MVCTKCKFHDSRGRDPCARAWQLNLYISLKFLFSTRRQTDRILMMTKEGSTKNCKFNNLWGKVPEVGWLYFFWEGVQVSIESLILR